MDNQENLQLEQAEKNYRESRIAYYRTILRQSDREMMRKLGKIPDDWEDAEAIFANLTEEERRLLSDIKKQRSWELKFESLYLVFITTIEDRFLDILMHRPLEEEEINEGIDALNHITLELGASLTNLKDMLLSLAKRQVSDLYYLITAYLKFDRRSPGNFEKDFMEFSEAAVNLFRKEKELREGVANILSFSVYLDDFFTRSTGSNSWKLNEKALKSLIAREKNDEEYLSDTKGSDDVSAYTLEDINRILSLAFLLKKRLRQDYLFIRYYFNEKDGKLFRLNFVTGALYQKMEENRIDEQVYTAMNEIRENFVLFKNSFEFLGQEGFGFHELPYVDLLEILYKGCRLAEQFYVRTARYDELENLRTEMLYYVEQEYTSINPDARVIK
jgi:hypothetical protein